MGGLACKPIRRRSTVPQPVTYFASRRLIVGGVGYLVWLRDCSSPTAALGCGLRPFLRGRNWPILLKKSATVSTAEKYALEIEIFTLSRGVQAPDFE